VQYSKYSKNYGVFNTETKICSCGGIKEFGYPCEHAYGVIVKNSLNELEYFNSSRIISLYSGSLISVDKEELSTHGFKSAMEIRRWGTP